jgi:hypothetical protein
MESEPEGRDEQASEEQEDEHPHVKSAAELSDRAAESVGRRYDATKESVHEDHAHDDETD